jgi:hypothetical protein
MGGRDAVILRFLARAHRVGVEPHPEVVAGAGGYAVAKAQDKHGASGIRSRSTVDLQGDVLLHSPEMDAGFRRAQRNRHPASVSRLPI